MRIGNLTRTAFRVGGFGTLGYVLSEVLHGHVADRGQLLVSALEVWAIVFVLWFAVEGLRGRR